MFNIDAAIDQTCIDYNKFENAMIVTDKDLIMTTGVPWQFLTRKHPHIEHTIEAYLDSLSPFPF